MKKVIGYYVTDSKGHGLQWVSNINNEPDFYYGNSVSMFHSRKIAQRRIDASYRNKNGLAIDDVLRNLKISRLTEGE